MIEKIKMRLNKSSSAPMYLQISDIIIQMTEKGEIKPNEKLPPIRKLSTALTVNNSTVVNAYRNLENRRIVYSIPGSGTYVSELGLISPKEAIIPEDKREHNFELKNSINFAATNTSLSLFPVDEFKLLFTEVLERDRGNAFDYQSSQGYEPLRKAICDYVINKGIKTGFDKIQIISGSQQGVDIVSKGILSAGDTVIVENPTYYGAMAAFMSRGSDVVSVDMTPDGIDIETLTAKVRVYRPKLLYIMTYYQTPTCFSYSIEKKRQLLELSAQYDFHIIEEDNLSDFYYQDKNKSPITPLKALDYKNRVIYIKSFSKILMPGLRLGFMIMPKSIMESVKSAKYVTDIETSGFVQRAFELFLSRGGFDAHVKKMTGAYKNRYNAMKEASSSYLKGKLNYSVPGGGLSFWYQCPKGLDSDEFCEKLLQNGIVVSPGSLFTANGQKSDYFRLSFANLLEKDIKNGIKMIGNLL